VRLAILVRSLALALALPRAVSAQKKPVQAAPLADSAGTAHAARDDEQDPNTSRLFFAPTGRTVRAGAAYLGDIYLIFPIIGVGITDRVTMAAGMSIIPGADRQLLYIAPKLGLVRSPTLNVAVGAIYVTVPGVSGYAAGGYAAATLGTEDRAVTLVAGYPVANGDRTREPVVMAGGELRIAHQTKLMVEGWKLPGASEVPVIFGFRFVGRKLSFDFGMMRVLGVEMQGFPFVPWVGFSIGIN
jgi:hypothetical protein